MSSTFFDFFHIFLICFLHSSSCVLSIHAFKLWTKRRKRDSNPRAAINDLLPFQGSPFGQLGYFSKLPYLLKVVLYQIIYRKFVRWAERVGFEPTRPCGQTVFKTASLWPLRYLSRSAPFVVSSSAHLVWYQHFFRLSTGNFTFFQKSFYNGENYCKKASATSRSSGVVILIFR